MTIVIFLRAMSIRSIDESLQGTFPFDLPVIRHLTGIEFRSPVTFFVGDNGSGKSTLLEAIAIASSAVTIGSENLHSDPTLSAQRQLARFLKLVWNKKPCNGFFLRAEDFFGFTKRLARERAEMLTALKEIDEKYVGRSTLARTLAKGPLMSSIHEWEQRYGSDLDANSHGESFLQVFQSRFAPNGLYLLDEPETPLSPNGQLALIALLDEMVAKNAQFIIATHSPILMAFPGAEIYSFDSIPINTVPYENVDHVVFTRMFLRDPHQFLRHLVNSGMNRLDK